MKIKKRFTKKDIDHIAEVYKIRLTPKEKARLVDYLHATAEHVKIFQKTKEGLGGLRPTFHPTATPNPLRDDKHKKPLAYEKVILNAPRKYQGYFMAPSVIWIKERNGKKN